MVYVHERWTDLDRVRRTVPTTPFNKESSEVNLDRLEDAVNHPSHYGGDVPYEAIKVITKWGLGFCLGNTVKYISRAGKKDPAAWIEDLEKARFYLDYEIKVLKGELPHLKED